MLEQPRDGFLVELAGGRVKWRPAVRARGMNQRRIRFQDVECAPALPIGDQEQIVRCGGGVSIVSLAPALFFFSNDRDDLVVPALGGERQRRRRVAMRIDSLARVGAVPHEQRASSPAERFTTA